MATKKDLTKTMEATAATLKGFTVVRRVTLPLWKWADGIEKFYRPTGAIHTGRTVSDTREVGEDGKKKGASTVKMEPAQIMTVIDLETNRECELIVGHILKSNLEDNYPKETYVGKSFSSIQSKVEGKRYRQYTLTEIAPE